MILRSARLAGLLLAGLAVSQPALAQQGAGGRGGGQNRPPANAEAQQPPRQDKQFPVGAIWIITSLNGKAPVGERPSLMVDDNFRARGFAGCNAFSATAYPLRGQGIAVGPIASTKKACDKAVMDQERQFLGALRTARNWDIVDGGFVVSGPGGEMRFERSF